MNIFKNISFLLFTLTVLFACKKESPIDTIAVNGALSGEFSVSKTQKVHFSQGNLKHPDNHTWSFATNQWENDDLFEWSHAKDSTFLDWGINPISNGGNQENQWRTLTMNEWMYLFQGRANAGYLFGFGKVNGVKGLIILPDNWDLTSDFKSATENGYGWNSKNNYKGGKWHEMENSGAVFLPAAGNYLPVEASGQSAGVYGDYWSATKISVDSTSIYKTDVFCVDFYQDAFYPNCCARWDYEFSVRLVQ